MILETTNYFPLPGQQDEVLAQRRKVSKIRAAIGLDPGEIFVRRDSCGPAVKWECRFRDQAAFDADMKARNASPDFVEGREKMRGLIEHFERHLHRLAD